MDERKKSKDGACAQILHLKGIRYLYQLNVFLYCMFGFVGLTLLLLVVRGPAKWKHATREERLAAAYSGE